jgi:hypothetical protein
VTGATLASPATDCFAALLAGHPTPWSAFRMLPDEFLRACNGEGLTGLVYERLRSHVDIDWPEEIHKVLARETRARSARELIRQRELISVFDELAKEDVYPIVMKGTALAYGLYENPSSRPRIDTDLLIRRNQVDAVRRVMDRKGYTEPLHCDGELLFRQFSLKKTDEFGLVHTFDFHWKISTQSVFADMLAFDEVAAVAVELPALGVHARTAGPLHSLLLACIHPVMHHRNDESLIWIYDVHLLASRLSEREFEQFTELAFAKHVSTICSHQLTVARKCLGTRIPVSAMTRLGAFNASEPSAAYLGPNRGWGDELISNMRGLPRWSDRLRLMREMALPGPTYVLKAYGFAPSSPGAALLPALYLHRLFSFCWKTLAGRK